MIIYEVFILGSNGMLGRYAELYFNSDRNSDRKSDDIYNPIFTIPLPRKKFDILKQDITYLKCILTTTMSERMIKSKNPYIKDKTLYKRIRVVLNCIMAPKDASLADTIQINSIFPHKLAVLCKDIGYKCINISTNAVFNSFGNHYEDDQTVLESKSGNKIDKNNLYMMSKALGEPNESIVIRTSIIGEDLNKKSLIERVKISSESKDQKIFGMINDMWNGVTCLELLNVIKKILYNMNPKLKVNNTYDGRIFHVYSSETISKYELIEKIRKVYNLNVTIVPQELPIRNNVLYSRNKIPTKPILEQLIELRDFGVGIF